MKYQVNIPEIPKPTITFEMTEEEARAVLNVVHVRDVHTQGFVAQLQAALEDLMMQIEVDRPIYISRTEQPSQKLPMRGH